MLGARRLLRGRLRYGSAAGGLCRRGFAAARCALERFGHGGFLRLVRLVVKQVDRRFQLVGDGAKIRLLLRILRLRIGAAGYFLPRRFGNAPRRLLRLNILFGHAASCLLGANVLLGHAHGTYIRAPVLGGRHGAPLLAG